LHFFYRHTTLPQPLELLVTHLQEQDSAMTMKSAIPLAELVLKARFLDKLAIHLQTLINVDQTESAILLLEDVFFLLQVLDKAAILLQE
jgi:hypothetical protein